MKKIILTVVTATSLMSAGAVVAGDAAAGKAKYVTCQACHGVNGISAIPNYPNLKGQKPAYVVKQLKAFKAGTRVDATMKAMVAALSAADMDNLAAYVAGM